MAQPLLIAELLARAPRAPPYINDPSVKGKPLTRYGLWSDSGILLSHPNFKTSTTLGNRASAPKLWNNLSSKIKIATPVNHFKKPLTTYLFSKAFSQQDKCVMTLFIYLFNILSISFKRLAYQTYKLLNLMQILNLTQFLYPFIQVMCSYKEA